MACRYLFVQLDEGGLELLLDVRPVVVLVYSLAVTLALLRLGPDEGALGWSREGVHGIGCVLGIHILFKFLMRYSLMTDEGRVVGGHEARQFGEVGSHGWVRGLGVGVNLN